MTPHELNLHILDYNEKYKQERDDRITLTYLGAAWQRANKMPDLKEILERPEAKKEQSDEAMLAQIKQFHTKLNGMTV